MFKKKKLQQVEKWKPVSSIWVTFQKEGIHAYPAALTDPALNTNDWDDVSFLGHPHRHVFHFKVRIEIFHDDREIEFLQFKRWLMRLYSENNKNENKTLNLNNKSCEMIAQDLYDEINENYPGRFVELDISEDNENGCSIFYPRRDF